VSKIRVLIADDHSLVRAGIRLLLEGYADIEVVGEAGGGCQVIELAAQLQPDVVLMDIAMSDLSGMEATAQIRERAPHARVLALTMHDREEYFFAMLQAGALGYVLKESQPDDLLAAIHAVYRGEAYLSPAVTKAVLTDYLGQRVGQNQSRYESLTLREKEILRLVADGGTTRDIGELLHLSEKTVEKHRAAIMHKLGLQSLSQLVKYAIRKGLIEMDD
jgi:two-component system, NarL family, response regulator NreC